MNIYPFLKNLSLVYVLVLVVSCVGDPIEQPMGKFESGVLIINEGSFGANDGDIHHYDPISGDLQPNVFESVNARPFAGLIQQVRMVDGLAYIVANTGKVEIVQAADFRSVGAVNDSKLKIPRDLQVIGQKLFISDYGPYDENWNNTESFVAVVEGLQGGAVHKQIPVPSRPEGMALIGSELWTACASGSQLVVINPATEEVARTVEVSAGSPHFFVQFGTNWYVYAIDAERVYFHRINRSAYSINETISIPLANAIYNGNFTLGTNGDVYIITTAGASSRVAKVSIETGVVLDAEYFVGSNFYGLGFDSSSNTLYVGDHAGWQGNGQVWKVGPSGSLIDSFQAGRGPSGFLFR
jgi:hypothetical protein